MAGTRRTDPLEVVYSALIGGLVSSFVAISVFTVFMDSMSEPQPPMFAAVAGLLGAAALMVGGILLADRMEWLGTALLFGSGFTAIWSVALSFSTESRWFTLLVLGAVIVAGLWLGVRRFGRTRTVAAQTREDAEPAGAGGDGE